MPWLSYTDYHQPHTVVGDLLFYKDLYSPQLDNTRDVLVWLPASYAENKNQRYPVLYMHDAQNVFDHHTSFVGEWQADETMQMLAPEGYEAIIVALPHQDDFRPVEYNPYEPLMPGVPPGRGTDYAAFVIETVKPLIDKQFRTQTAPARTGVLGSSLGGLISLYIFLMHQDVFGLCGAFSPAYSFDENGLLETVTERASGYGRIYVDIGTSEGDVVAKYWPNEADPDQFYVDGVRTIRDRLLAHGYRSGENLIYVEETGGRHNEDAWARRLPDALRFLLG